MKTKKESNASLATLSEPWRNIRKGEQVESKKKQLEEQPKFLVGPYIRLSPTGDEREEGSLVSHPQRIKQFIESKNIQHGGAWGEVVDWYVDKDLSGKDMNRPSFQRMLSDIRSGRINAVIVTELSRLNRKVKDFCEVWEFFKKYNVAFFSLKENFDTSSPMGELMLIQAMSFAQFERHTIVDRIKRGSRARAERGLANGGVLLGFKRVEHRPNYRDINESEKSYVELIFRKFLELKRLSLVVEFLHKNGYRTKEHVTRKGKKTGGNRWTIGSVHSLLTNRAYIGEREVNKRFRAVDPEKLKDDEQYFCVDAHWPALISKELFFDVQSLLEQNKKKARKYVHDYRLTGLIGCSQCGQKLVGKCGNGTSAKYFYYGHKRKMMVGNDQHLHRCKIENVPALQLDEAIISRLKDLSTDKALVAELVRSTGTGASEKIEHQKAMMATKEQERRKLDQKLKNLYEAISDEVDRDLRLALSEKAKETKTLMGQVESAIEDLKRDCAKASNVIDISSVLTFLQIFRNGAFDALPVAAQAEILKDRVRRIVVRENGVYVEIFGRKSEPVLLRALDGGGGNYEGSKVRSSTSNVRTVSKLARSRGFEPLTT